MKAVLIAESEDTISEYTSFLEDAGADVITYRWFLKALDNLTEIQPHIILVSALDFPRHWKTLFTHIEAGEIKTQPLVYLITDPAFTAEEKKKAMFLGAQDILFSPLTYRDKNSLLSMLPAGMTGDFPAAAPDTPETGDVSAAAESEQIPQEAEPEQQPSLSEAITSDPDENSEYAALKEQMEADALKAEEEAAAAEHAASSEERTFDMDKSVHDIAAAEAAAFDIIDSEISGLDNDNGPASDIGEVSEDSGNEASDSFVVEGADEDILTKLEDEMTIKELPDDLKEPSEEAEADSSAETEPEAEAFEAETPSSPSFAEEPVVSEAPSFDNEPSISEAPSFDNEPSVSKAPSFDDEPPVSRHKETEQSVPEQIYWSAPVDETAPDSIIPTEPAAETPSDSFEDEPPLSDDPVLFSFVNPTSGLVVTGSVQDYDHPTIKFIPSSDESVKGIRFGQILDQCKFTFEGETVKARAQIRGLGTVIEFCLLY